MHDAIPSMILNEWLQLEEDLFHLQALSYLPPQILICFSTSYLNYNIKLVNNSTAALDYIKKSEQFSARTSSQSCLRVFGFIIVVALLF